MTRVISLQQNLAINTPPTLLSFSFKMNMGKSLRFLLLGLID